MQGRGGRGGTVTTPDPVGEGERPVDLPSDRKGRGFSILRLSTVFESSPVTRTDPDDTTPHRGEVSRKRPLTSLSDKDEGPTRVNQRNPETPSPTYSRWDSLERRVTTESPTSVPLGPSPPPTVPHPWRLT